MTKSIFHTKTNEDYSEAVRQLSELTGDSLGSNSHETYGDETCVFAGDSLLTYGSYSYALGEYGKAPQLFKVGMKIVKAPSGSEEHFIAVGQDKEAALQKLEELEAKVAELKAELTKPAEPLYQVVLPNPNVPENANVFSLRKFTDAEGNTKVVLTKVKLGTFTARSNTSKLLTEDEIKEDFEWAWQFAERVK
ncbi:DUF1642 domain-containing protein [Enterococcus casseliflavus]|uniref:DUF1642 domain-containing protein n=1 Tax=Enterococcus casseliflavus TaxID=37734 RepID=UPI0014330AC8|nr:DUF1642 domain-containing protein [Enterococcus casseliflavus]NKD38267.1 DUF1642 domain-containing protein [Enterococcus casseliflavus]